MRVPQHSRMRVSFLSCAGVYTGGDAAAVQAVKTGGLTAAEFKFFAGALVWQDNQLQQELDKGAW